MLYNPTPCGKNNTCKINMLKDLIKVVCCSFLLSSCSQIESVIDIASPQQPEAIVINEQYTAQLSEDDNNYYTDYSPAYSCNKSLTKPTKTEPNWIPPSDIWQRIRIGMRLNHNIDNPRFISEFNWYQKNTSYMTRVSERANRYIYHVVEHLEQNNMPLELALLPIVESAYDPFAYSHGRASGMWQFIPSTGRSYKLTQDWWYDGRRDIVASTTAAADYLQALSKIYDGDWLLALAAYNSGQGTVNRAIRKNKANNKPTDFWALDLPKETRSYVPKLLALAKLIDNPIRYGVNLYNIENKPYFAAVDTQSQIDLAQAANMAQIDIDELYRLNPGFNRWATSPDGPHQLLVPVEKQTTFEQALTQLDASQRMQWKRYTVKNGDVLSVLAKRFNTDTSTIKQANKLNNNLIRAGQSLMIPTASQQQAHYSLSAKERLNATKQQRASTDDSSTKIVHRVESGESLWTISRQYNITVNELAHWNGIAPKDPLKIHQELNIWSKNASTSSVSSINQREKVVKKVGYKVRSGDSLARIADKFNIRTKDIINRKKINAKKYLQTGQH
jgi:membrane-bound lytic murein transglycosylase D